MSNIPNFSYTRQLLNSIIRAQNEKIIERISKRYDLDPEEMKQKYLQPNFYDVYNEQNTVYNVTYVEK